MPTDAKRSLVEPEHERMSIARQCELLGMSRAAYYYEPWEWDETALVMLRAIDEEYTRHPFLGKRRMRDYLVELGYDVGGRREDQYERGGPPLRQHHGRTFVAFREAGGGVPSRRRCA